MVNLRSYSRRSVQENIDQNNVADNSIQPGLGEAVAVPVSAEVKADDSNVDVAVLSSVGDEGKTDVNSDHENSSDHTDTESHHSDSEMMYIDNEPNSPQNNSEMNETSTATTTKTKQRKTFRTLRMTKKSTEFESNN